jgi:transposase
MVLDHRGEHGSQHAAIRSIAAKIGCSDEILRDWIRQAERDLVGGAAGLLGMRAGSTRNERERITALGFVGTQGFQSCGGVVRG